MGVGGEINRDMFGSRRCSGIGGSSGRYALVILVSLMCAAAATESRAFGLAVLRSPEEAALAMDAPVFSLVFEAAPGDSIASSWSVQAGEWRLFDDAGLSATVCGGHLRRGDWGCGVRAAMVSSPIGEEAVLTGAILTPVSGRVRLAGDVRFNVATFDGFERAYLLCLSLHALLRLSPHVALCPGVENIRVRGEESAGADASLLVAAFSNQPLCGVVETRVSRRGALTFGVSSRLRVGHGVVFAVGYDDGTGTLNGSLSLRFRSMGLEAGASVHPVLGVSEGLFMSWRR